jgi:hypothetical protein
MCAVEEISGDVQFQAAIFASNTSSNDVTFAGRQVFRAVRRDDWRRLCIDIDDGTALDFPRA